MPVGLTVATGELVLTAWDPRLELQPAPSVHALASISLAMALASQEGAACVEAAHLLAGLALCGGDLPVVLRNTGLRDSFDLPAALVVEPLACSEASLEILKRAQQTARELKHELLATLHLGLGLLDCAPELLSDHGVQLPAMRRAVTARLKQGASLEMPDSEPARWVLELTARALSLLSVPLAILLLVGIGSVIFGKLSAAIVIPLLYGALGFAITGALCALPASRSQRGWTRKRAFLYGLLVGYLGQALLHMLARFASKALGGGVVPGIADLAELGELFLTQPCAMLKIALPFGIPFGLYAVGLMVERPRLGSKNVAAATSALVLMGTLVLCLLTLLLPPYAIQINATRTLGTELGAAASIMIAACLAFCHLVSQPIHRRLRQRLLRRWPRRD